jgi:hypothetical protein
MDLCTCLKKNSIREKSFLLHYFFPKNSVLECHFKRKKEGLWRASELSLDPLREASGNLLSPRLKLICGLSLLSIFLLLQITGHANRLHNPPTIIFNFVMLFFKFRISKNFHISVTFPPARSVEPLMAPIEASVNIEIECFLLPSVFIYESSRIHQNCTPTFMNARSR